MNNPNTLFLKGFLPSRPGGKQDKLQSKKLLYTRLKNEVKSYTHHETLLSTWLYLIYGVKIMYIATIQNGGFTYYLRGRTWAFNLDRAFKYETLEAINEAISAVKSATKPALRKLITIEKIA